MTYLRRLGKMGLDIILARIEDKEIRETNWLLVRDNPELENKFSEYKRTKHFEYPDEEYDDDVYYYSDISYQRKGVTKDFFDKVENDKCLVDKEDVERLAELVDKDLRQDFKQNFIDKFIDGQTFLIIGW